VKLKGPSQSVLIEEPGSLPRSKNSNSYEQPHWLTKSGELPNLLILTGFGYVLQSVGK
jgi:hypothetical protein